MVNASARLMTVTTSWPVSQLAAADDKAQPLLWRLDPQQRAHVLMALLGLALVGAGLVAIVIVGARYLRRLARKRPGPTPADELWYRKPLVPAEPRDAPDQTPGSD